MAQIYSYWDSDTKELINFTHTALINKGNRVEIELEDTHAIFSEGIPGDVYQLNTASDGIETI